MTPRSRTAILLLLSLTLAATATAEPRIVDSPAIPRQGDQVLQPEELWRWGGDEENDPLLGRITDVAVGADGDLYVLDANQSVIHVLGPAGELRRTIGGEGDGPGEFRNAAELALMPGGDLGVMEMMPGRLVVMSPTGEPRTSFRPEGADGAMMALPSRFEADADGVVVGMFGADFSDGAMVSWNRLARYGTDGSLLSLYRETSQKQEGNSISLSSDDEDADFTRNWTLLPDGRLALYAKAYAYELEILAADGTTEAVYRRPYETLHYSDEEMDEQRRQRESMRERMGVTVDAPLQDRHRDIDSVVAAPFGELWVATSRGLARCPDGSLGVFDVFNADGVFDRTLRFDGLDYDPARDDYVIRGDLILVFKESRMTSPKMSTAGGGDQQMVMISGANMPEDGDDDGEFRAMEVVCYRFKPGC